MLTVVSPGEVVRAGDESVEGRALLFSSLTRPQCHVAHDTSDRVCHNAQRSHGLPITILVAADNDSASP